MKSNNELNKIKNTFELFEKNLSMVTFCDACELNSEFLEQNPQLSDKIKSKNLQKSYTRLFLNNVFNSGEKTSDDHLNFLLIILKVQDVIDSILLEDPEMTIKYNDLMDIISRDANIIKFLKEKAG